MRQLGAVALACLLAGGCASIVNHAPVSLGKTAMQSVEVTSEPAGARITVAGKELGITPTKILLKRRDAGIVLRLEKDGYEPSDVRLKRTVGKAVAGNLAFALFAVPLPHQGLADDPLSNGERAAIAFGLPATAIAIDFLNGAAYNLPARVEVTLKPRHK